MGSRQPGPFGTAPSADLPPPLVARALVAGKVIAAQHPPTAKGVGFLVLEGETGRVQTVLPPALAGTIHQVLAESHLIAVSGTIERTRAHHTLLARQIRPLPRNAPRTERQPAVQDGRNERAVPA